MPRWVFRDPPISTRKIDPAIGLSNFLVKVLEERGLTDSAAIQAFLDPAVYTPASPYDLPGLVEGVSLLAEAIRSGKRIGVWGDFDVDGQTSTTLLVEALRLLNADVVYHIPVRATESHGIKIPDLQNMLDGGIDLLLTCDTGVSEHESIRHAQQSGANVIVTDHHDLPSQLPPAEAVINPKLLPHDNALASLPGVGVAYKFIEALFSEFGREGEESRFLDLTALGIVADVAEVVGDTRYLLQRGIAKLRQTDRLGLKELFVLAEVEPTFLNEEDIGFRIAPRLNALGRLGDANGIVEFLITKDLAAAQVFANRLEGLNARRKMLSSQVFQGALSQIEKNPDVLRQPSLVLGSEYWPAGIIGIVASRLADRFGKPTILFQFSEDGIARGSARSVPGCDIGAAIRGCADYLIGFGGHPMAAGVSLKLDNLNAFTRVFNQQVIDQVGEEALEPELKIDRLISLEEINHALVQQIDRLRPFGSGNPPVTMVACDLKLVGSSMIGRDQDHRKLIVEDGDGNRQSVLWWQGAEWDLPRGKFDLAFSASTSFFRGELQVQVVLEDFRQTEEAVVEIQNKIKVIDYRGRGDSDALLAEIILKYPDAVLWGEGDLPAGQPFKGRNDLFSAEALVIWTSPPALQLLKNALAVVEPVTVIIFDQGPEWDDLSGFLNRLTGLLKFVLSKRGGCTDLDELAQALAQTEVVVRLGIAWLEVKGLFRIEYKDEGEITLAVGEQKKGGEDTRAIQEDLALLLREVRLFRKTFAESPIEILLPEISREQQ